MRTSSQIHNSHYYRSSIRTDPMSINYLLNPSHTASGTPTPDITPSISPTPSPPPQLSPAEKRILQKRKIQSEKKRQWRKNLSPEQRQRRQMLDAQRKREQRMNQTEEQRASARRKDAARKAAKRKFIKDQKQGEEQRKARVSDGSSRQHHVGYRHSSGNSRTLRHSLDNILNAAHK